MSNKLELVFPLTNGGKETGFNDSGIETFLGKPNYYIARECGQNVGDVARKGVDTVDLKFSLMEIPASDIPCLEELRTSFQASRDFISDPKGIAFFDRALKQIGKKKIQVLKISDYGTTGLLGADDDRAGGWYGLVRSEGVTNKFEGGTGGGFGIGKYAAFAGSGFRTVFYSTRTQDGNFGFQGVSHLVSHKNSTGRVTQGTGYIGHHDADEFRFDAIRTESEIPELFRRPDTGLDIFVLDFLFAEDWETTMCKSVLENFWPAIHFGQIKFQVEGQEINDATLPGLMNQFAADENFEAYYHYQAVVSPENREDSTTLKHLGEVEIYLVKGNDNFPKSVARVRKSGMIIDKRNCRSRVPYAGLFRCTNDKGNKLLKKMEPPRHDEFQPERAPENGQKALNELNSWLASCVKKLNPILNTSTLDIPDLHRFLPDVDDQDDVLQESDSPTESEESFDVTVPPLTPEVTSVALPTYTAQLETEADDGQGGSGAGVEGENDGDGDGGSGGGSDEGGGNGDQPGNNGGDKKPGRKQYVKIQTRTIQSNDSTHPIILCVRAEENFEGDLIVCGVGEDGSDIPVTVSKAVTDAAKPKALQIQDDNEIGGIKLKKAKPTRIRLAFDSPVQAAIKVTGRRA